MRKYAVAFSMIAFVMIFTSISVAQWTSFDDDRDSLSSQRRQRSSERVTGRLEYVVIGDETYRPDDFDGAREVTIYSEYVVVRKGRGRSAAVIIPFDNLKYLVLD